MHKLIHGIILLALAASLSCQFSQKRQLPNEGVVQIHRPPLAPPEAAPNVSGPAAEESVWVACEPISEAYQFAANGTLEIFNGVGDITIETWNREKILVEAQVQRPKDADPNLKVTVEVKGNADLLKQKGTDAKAQVKAPAGWIVHLRLKVPHLVHLVPVEASAGKISIKDVSGRVTVKTGKGDIHIQGQVGPVVAESREGRILIGLQEFYRRVHARTGKGDIELALSAEVALDAVFTGSAEGGRIEGQRYQQLQDGRWGEGRDGSVELITGQGNIMIH